jgi:hypothetical protein
MFLHFMHLQNFLGFLLYHFLAFKASFSILIFVSKNYTIIEYAKN